MSIAGVLITAICLLVIGDNGLIQVEEAIFASYVIQIILVATMALSIEIRNEQQILSRWHDLGQFSLIDEVTVRDHHREILLAIIKRTVARSAIFLITGVAFQSSMMFIAVDNIHYLFGIFSHQLFRYHFGRIWP